MRLTKRVALWLSVLLSVLLTSIVLRDIYVDWLIEGNALWSTALENGIPVVLALGVLAGSYGVYTRHDGEFMSHLTRWQYLGTVGILLVGLEVVGLQLIQGQLKPRLIIVQMAIGGAVAGTLVGYATARSNEARRDIERERDKFEALFDNAPAAGLEVRLADGTLTIEQTNAAFEEMFGLPAVSVAGEPLFDIVSHESDTRDEIRQAVSEGVTMETETTAETTNGQKDFQLRVVPFGNHQRAYLLYADVTEMRNIQRNLEESVRQLESSNDRLQQFAYIASHDLQEPARMVSSYVSLLEQEYGDELDEEALEYMAFAVDGADRMQAMIDGLLDYSRVRTQADEFTETDTEAILDEVLQDLELLIDDGGAAVTHGELPAVDADRRQLGQVFQNLVENAVEHGGSTVHVGAEHRDDEVVFSVADDGPGIQTDRQDRVFELFEQGSRDGEGTGIGLAICDRIVSRHGGEMWLESEDGDGTTFYFTIPEDPGQPAGLD